MQLSTSCVRCQLRLLSRGVQTCSISRRNFVSIAPEFPEQYNKQSQDGFVPLPSKDGQKSIAQAGTAKKPKRQDADESMRAVLEELFDANRHKAPSTTSRYSRQPQAAPLRGGTNSIERGDADQVQLQEYAESTHYSGYSMEHEPSPPAAVKYAQKRRDHLFPASPKQQPVQDSVLEHNTMLRDEKEPWLTEDASLDRTSSRSRTHSNDVEPITRGFFSARRDKLGTKSTTSKIAPRSKSFTSNRGKATVLNPGSRVSQSDISPDRVSLPERQANSVKTILSEAIDEKAVRNSRGIVAISSSDQQEMPMRSESMNKMAQSAPNAYIKNSTKSEQFRLHVAQQNYKMTHELWNRFKGELGKGEHAREELDTLFADFLEGFVELRKLEPINEVWKMMLQHDIKPKVRHYNALLSALLKNQQYNKFIAIWQDMTNSSVCPDNQSWTTYISIAFKARNWQEVMRIVDRMGDSWRAAIMKRTAPEQPTIEEKQYLPSIVPINATITGLLRLHLSEIVGDVLTWSDSFGILQDTSTYNILLRYACRNEGDEKVQTIIANMEKNNVKQDIITKTILLDSSIRDPNSALFRQSPEEQEETILSELERLFRGSERPSANTFAVIMHSLLHVAKPNLPAARAMFLLMLQYNIKVSPQIYTILFTHYFNMENTDLEALDTLWSKIEKNGSRIDHILYDRMIEGYGSIGQIGKMMLFFQKMTERGLIPGWLALSQALLALAEQRRWDLCTDFVKNVTKEGGHLRFGRRGWKGEKEFWQIVRELREQHLIPNEQ